MNVLETRLMNWFGRIGLFLGLLLLAGTAVVQAITPLDVGYLDFSYPSGIGGNGAATSEKPESKLWHHDGAWWASMWSSSGDAYHIYKLDWQTQEWEDTGVELDDRLKSKADVLSDGNTLYVVSHIFATKGAAGSAGDESLLFRYSYSGGSYSLDAGFPVAVNGDKSEALTIAKDSTGMLWITWVANQQVMVNHSNASGGGDSDWATPFALPVSDSNVKSDDISAVIAFDGYIGVMYSRQTSGIKMYFAAHQDGTAVNQWGSTVAFETSGDDHMNLKSLQSDNAGKIFAAVKTSLNAILMQLLVCDSQASSCTDPADWEAYLVYDGTYAPTRPLLLLDTSNREIYYFVRPKDINGTNTGADIYYKKTSMDDIQFDPSSPGLPFIASDTYLDLNDPTSTKQNLNASTGLVVLANDDREKVYVHNCLDLGGTPSPLCGSTDAAAVARFSSATYEAREGDAATVDVMVELSKPAESAVSVDYSVTANSATASSDYTASSSGTLNFAQGEITKTLTISVVNDDLIEPSETIDLALTDASGVVLGTPQTAVFTILDDDTPPTVHFSSDSYSGSEADGSLTAEVVLDYAFDETIQVDYLSSDGTATAGSDYTPISGTLTFAVGETSQLLTLPLLNEADYEANETVTLTLSNPQVATAGEPLVATLTILNDDQRPAVAFSTGTASVGEANGSYTVTMTLSAASFETITADLASADQTAEAGADYTAISETISFAPGETEKTAVLTLLDDDLHEGDETAVLQLANPSNATLGNPASQIVTIVDDEQPPTVQLSQASYTVAENGGSLPVTVTLSVASAVTATVDLATANGTATAGADYTAVSKTISFAPGETEKTAVIPITDDLSEEGNETATLTLSNPTVAVLGSPASATLTIIDDDVPPTIQLGSTTFSGREADGSIAVLVQLVGLTDETVTVDYATSDAMADAPNPSQPDGSLWLALRSPSSDYTPVSGTLSFAPGELEKTVLVPLIDDEVDEITETLTIALSNIVNGLAGEPLTATLSIIDDDDPPQVSLTTAVLTANEGAGTAEVQAELSLASEKTVTVAYATADKTAVAGDDYDAISGTLTFAPGQTTQSFLVPLIDDTLDEPAEQLLIALADPENGTLTAPMTATLTINDNDDPPAVQFREIAVSALEADAEVAIVVVLETASAKSITVDFATLPGTAVSGDDYQPISGTLTFAPGDTEQQFAVPLLDDDQLEEDESILLALSSPTNATLGAQADSTLWILDDDTPRFQFSASELTVGEGAGMVMAEVVLSRQPTSVVQISYETVAGTAETADFGATSGAITFFPGDALTKTVTIPIVNDQQDEIAEQFQLLLSNPQGAVLGDPSMLTITINDNDPAPTIAFSSATYQQSEMWGFAEVWVTLDRPSGQTVLVEYATGGGTATAGSDYTPSSGMLLFVPGETAQRIIVPLNNDQQAEGTETVGLTLANPTNATLGLASATLTIRDGGVYLPLLQKRP